MIIVNFIYCSESKQLEKSPEKSLNKKPVTEVFSENTNKDKEDFMEFYKNLEIKPKDLEKVNNIATFNGSSSFESNPNNISPFNGNKT